MTSAPRAVPAGVNSWNAAFLDDQYARYQADPTSVAPDVRAFFQGFELASAGGASLGAASGQHAGGSSSFQHAVDDLVTAYRRLGHVHAKLDPFGRRPREQREELTLAYHGLVEADLDRPVHVTVGTRDGATLREVLAHLEKTYCSSVGLEFTHISSREEREWFLRNYEQVGGRVPLSAAHQRRVLEQLLAGESFERFLQKRYPGDKRFSLEGAESLIPSLNNLLERATELGVAEAVLGMAHRGRLNVLINIMGKTYEQVFTEFEDNWEKGFADGGGDVKYHRGYSGEREFGNGKRLHLAMASNPSHLESVGPVVLGRCRAKQRLRNDMDRVRTIPVLIHGDAAVAGQGVVAECLNFSQLEGYRVGGGVHVVVNNQIGFTTVPEDARSSRYCTDVAKMIEAPIFHVNAEDPEAVVAVSRLAIEFRQQFRKDVFIDLVCYRKYGHNEQDEQTFTQPVLAGLIKNQPSTLTSYAARLRDAGVITEDDLRAVMNRIDEQLDKAQQSAKAKPNTPTIDPGGKRWSGLVGEYSFKNADTGVSKERLAEVAAALGRTPEGMNVNPKLKPLLKARAEIPTSPGLVVGHADAEILAIGTLLLDGIPVRLSGQDCRRGTFSQRHAVLRDFATGEPYNSLNQMREMGVPGVKELEPGTKASDGRARQAKFCVYDSPLSEEGVLGFDYGYSLADPNMLVMWEGQFGDFFNGAQVVVDQYLASSEIKWHRWSGLVMLLPHGYEGAGPEHSSARLERFLELCADENMEVVMPSTGAQMFHLLRRVVARNFRKPLIVMTPKSMLRTPTSSAAELLTGTRFQEIIDDAGIERKGVKRVVLCSGKLYHELAERRALLENKDVALVRVEQFYPLHTDLLKRILAGYGKGVEVVWCQEEPRNAGAWRHMALSVRETLGVDLVYIGREASASPAVGSKTKHKYEQEAILAAAVGAKPKKDEGTKNGQAGTGSGASRVSGKPGVKA